MTTLLKAQLRRSLKSVPTVEAKDAVSAALGSMLANQQAAARARVENPEPSWDNFTMEPMELDPVEPDELDEDARHFINDEPTEQEQITASHFEEHDTDRMWGREDE